mmetsp:Transcript_9705/g.26440  ORF Transcript_9705/g.26440 Transcript_9705/m.26440 type:complete len:247 (-) Transcript_9705:1464-2204(-)
MILAFSTSSFNSLVHDFHDVRHYGDSKKELRHMCPVLNKFGDLFLAHGKEKHLFLCLTHRHFQLKDGEKKVAKQESNEIHIKPLPENEAASSIPYMFLPIKADGKPGLVPLEYVIPSDDQHKAELEEAIEAACDEVFLEAFAELAKQEKVERIYGISLKCRYNLACDEDTETTLEMPGAGPRSLVVKVMKAEGLKDTFRDVTTVGWYFTKDKHSSKSLFNTFCDHPNICVHHGCYNHCIHCLHSSH